MAFFRAGLDASSFYEQNPTQARAFSEQDELIAHSMRLANRDGLILEFGVATGRTITEIARYTRGPVFDFDSFEGLPETWFGDYARGAVARDGLLQVPENVSLIKGWFSETLPVFLEENPGAVSFLHVDCDLYSSASLVLECLADRMGAGTVILFDRVLQLSRLARA